jgi:hypothetical protein
LLNCIFRSSGQAKIGPKYPYFISIERFENTFREIPPSLPFSKGESFFECNREKIPFFPSGVGLPPLHWGDEGGFDGFSKR